MVKIKRELVPLKIIHIWHYGQIGLKFFIEAQETIIHRLVMGNFKF